MELFDVHVLGFEVSEDRATRALMRVFGLSEASARIFVQSVPRVGKRRVPKDTAERYIRALHAVGAMVECRLCGALGTGPSGSESLPPPAASSFPTHGLPHIMQDSFGVMAPVAFAPHMPQIPKAPRVPADLHAIRARKGPDSLAPHWRPTDGPDSRRDGAPRTQQSSSGAGPELQSPNPEALALETSARAGLASPAIALEQVSSGAAGPARAADGAVFDSDGQLGAQRSSPTPVAADPDTPWYAQPTHQLVLAALVIGSVTLAASSGMFDTDASRLGRAFQEAGIQAGQYDRARMFLTASDTALQGMSKPEATQLIDALLAAGGVEAWVTGITQHAGIRSSRQVLLELPEDRAQRRRIFDVYAHRLPHQQSGVQDRGQRFLSILF